jgi:SAM-dependent methyltransferase
MGFGEFFVGSLMPPMPIDSDSVDLLYAVSVLTHLDATHQAQWLMEWARVLKPGGLAIVTFNGDDFVEKHLSHSLAYKERVLLLWEQQDGIAFVDDGGWAGIFPDAYQTTYQTFSSVRDRWSVLFEVLEIKPSGSFANRQDCAILKRRNA